MDPGHSSLSWVWGPLLLIWGDCQEPPRYTELMEGLSSKCKVIIPDFLI